MFARTRLTEAILYVTRMEIRTASPEHESQPFEPAPRISHAQRLEINRAIHRTLGGAWNECGEGGTQWVYNRLRVKLNLQYIEDLHPDHLMLVLDEIKQLEQDLSAYFSFRIELREFICREVIGAGTPWTPHEARKWRARMKQLVPPRLEWLAMRKQLLSQKKED